MPNIKSYNDLEVYQESYECSIIVIKGIVFKLPKEERFDLADQLRRSVKSIPRLIVEGYAKKHMPKHFAKYLTDALGECNETVVSLQHVRDLYDQYINIELCESLIQRYNILGRRIYTLADKWKKFY